MRVEEDRGSQRLRLGHELARDGGGGGGGPGGRLLVESPANKMAPEVGAGVVAGVAESGRRRWGPDCPFAGGGADQRLADVAGRVSGVSSDPGPAWKRL